MQKTLMDPFGVQTGWGKFCSLVALTEQHKLIPGAPFRLLEGRGDGYSLLFAYPYSLVFWNSYILVVWLKK